MILHQVMKTVASCLMYVWFSIIQLFVSEVNVINVFIFGRWYFWVNLIHVLYYIDKWCDFIELVYSYSRICNVFCSWNSVFSPWINVFSIASWFSEICNILYTWKYCINGQVNFKIFDFLFQIRYDLIIFFKF